MTKALATQLDEDGQPKFGPAMRKLNDRQRAFVWAMLSPTGNGDLNHLEAARLAGYSGDNASLRVTGYRLYHDERIRAAMLEEGHARLGAAVPIATAVLVQIAQNSLKEGPRLKAISMILNRAGLPEITKHEVAVKRELSETEKIERAVSLAKSLGLDPRTLLGKVGVTLPPEPAPVSPEPPGSADAEIVDAEVIATTAGIEDLLGPATS